MKLLLIIIGLLLVHEAFPNIKKDSVVMAPFGKVAIYIPEKTPESVTIMISGDSGWKYGVLGFSEHFASKNSLVIGVDILKYYKNLRHRKEECYHIVGDFISLVTFIEKKYSFPQYQEPVLMGYSSGATLVYALLAQSRPNTFKGGISLGFCPDVELPKQFCELNGLKEHPMVKGKGFDLNPDSRLGNRWIVLQGKLDNVCGYQNAVNFINQSADAELITLENVGHGFSKWIDFMPQWDKAYQSLINPARKLSASDERQLDEQIKDLPVVVTQSKTNNENEPLFLFISGDGGWYSFEQNLSDRLAEIGIPTIGLDAKKYFWNRRTPGESAKDITALLNHYTESWGKNEIVLMGYSMGAEVMPFIYEQFPKEIRDNIERIVLLSPDTFADFEIHLTNMIGIGNYDNSYDVVAELKKITTEVPVLIITGDAEDSSLPSDLSSTRITFAKVQGDHHYNNDTQAIFNLLKDKNVLK